MSRSWSEFLAACLTNVTEMTPVTLPASLETIRWGSQARGESGQRERGKTEHAGRRGGESKEQELDSRSISDGFFIVLHGSWRTHRSICSRTQPHCGHPECTQRTSDSQWWGKATNEERCGSGRCFSLLKKTPPHTKCPSSTNPLTHSLCRLNPNSIHASNYHYPSHNLDACPFSVYSVT